MTPLTPERQFYDNMRDVFFDIAYRIFTAKLTSRASLELPSLRAFDVFSKTWRTSLTKEDILVGVEQEFVRQRLMHDRLTNLQEHFSLMGARYEIDEPQEKYSVFWDHAPSFGAWLRLDKDHYPALYAFPTTSAHTFYSNNTKDASFEQIVFCDAAVTIIIPHSIDRNENHIAQRNDMLQAPIETIERDSVRTEKGWFGKTKKVSVIRQRIERHYDFLLVDVPREITADDIDRWMKLHSVSAVIVTDRGQNITVLHPKNQLPKLHQELRRIAQLQKEPSPVTSAPSEDIE